MGGEAIKSLQIFEEMLSRGIQVHQITHERVEKEMSRHAGSASVSYVRDLAWHHLFWRSVVLRPLLGLHFMREAALMAERLARDNPDSLVHYTGPVSPVLPHYPVAGASVIIGPINGNIHYPPALAAREPLAYKLRRVLHPLAQRWQRTFFSGKQRADILLVAGGQRTRSSLSQAGCHESRMVTTLDSGIPARLAKLERVPHTGRNMRFVHNGRLVVHKGVDLAIMAVARARLPVELDIIGRGPVLDDLKQLAAKLGVAARVHFKDWIADHDAVAPTLQQYRGFVFPSLAEANGIVVQEAMMLGLPTICLNWGGPSLLINPECGILVDAGSEDAIVAGLADAMDRLAGDGELAERLASNGRQRALDLGFSWPDLVDQWLGVYGRARPERATAAPLTAPRPVA